MSWLILQLADSAFPAGGFAHSGGLESAVQAGAVRGETQLRAWMADALWSVASSALPFVGAAHGGEFAGVDRACDAFLVSTVGNRASRTQGRALLETCARSFPHEAIAALRSDARAHACHYAPIFGVCAAALGAARDEALRVFLHLQLRATASAAVRLGVIGPHLAQRIHFDLHATLEEVATRVPDRIEDAAVTAPLHELFGATHDRLYSRLFQS